MLKPVLIANALSCALFGGVFLANGAGVAAFLGGLPVWLVEIVGAGLVFHALHLGRAAARAVPARREVLYFAAGDALWVAGSLALIALGLIDRPGGLLATLAVAGFVGACGWLQWRHAPGGRAAS